MQDVFGLFGDSPLTQIFTAHGTDWQLWEKPRGITFVSFTIISGGGGGGAGFSAAASAARGGGGGGGGSSRINAIVPALFLPDRLYVQVGIGGVSAGAGAASNISANRSTNAGLVIAQGTAGNAGGTGTGSAAGAAGAAGSGPIMVQHAIFWGVTNAVAGCAGGAGGAQTGAVGVTGVMFGSLVSGGAGGGGTTSADFAGGPETSPDTSVIPTIAGGLAGSNRGNDGYLYRGEHGTSWLSLGGSGGGASNAGVGGAGGNGGPGSGGGGGGGGTTGGAGGKGGDGFVVIVCS